MRRDGEEGRRKRTEMGRVWGRGAEEKGTKLAGWGAGLAGGAGGLCNSV